MNQFLSYPRLLVFLSIALALPAFGAGSEAAPAPAAMPRTEETNSQEMMRSYLQLQEQIHATQLAIERSRQESDAAAARNAEALATRLQAIDQALAAQRAHELDVMQSQNRVLLIVAGTFAGMGLLAMLLMAVFQWRTVNRLAEISAALPPGPGMGGARPIGLLGAGEAPLAAHAPEQTNQRLLGALDRLEKRIYELEHTAQPPLPPAPGEPVADEPELHATPANGAAEPAGNGQAAVVEGSSDVARLLGQGQALLDANKAEEALACFDQVLRLDANHTDALVKKGAALEKLQKLDEAIECYDRAIAADGSMTIAYLYKGGVFNRLERFSEALKCYEQALRTQEGRRG